MTIAEVTKEYGISRDTLRYYEKAGRIRHLGFSTHGRVETIEKFLKLKGEYMEFAQVQLNYLDWKLQEAGKKYDLLTEYGLPVIVMEPVRGGSLASLSEESDRLLKAARPNSSIASWAFRFLQTLPNVQVVLSGMTTMEQLKENIDTFSKEDPITDKEKALLEKAVEPMLDLVPCTACRYCCEGCPQNLDIPNLISMYNEMSYSDSHVLRNFTIRAMRDSELPSACIGCGACVQLCPQGIDIPDIMAKYAVMLAK